MVVEVNNRTKRFTVVEVILYVGIAREAADTDLHPSVAADNLRLGQPEILHDSETFRVRPEIGMPESGAAILIGVRKRELVSDEVFLQKTEGVANANVVICLGHKSGANKIGS